MSKRFLFVESFPEIKFRTNFDIEKSYLCGKILQLIRIAKFHQLVVSWANFIRIQINTDVERRIFKTLEN